MRALRNRNREPDAAMIVRAFLDAQSKSTAKCYRHNLRALIRYSGHPSVESAVEQLLLSETHAQQLIDHWQREMVAQACNAHTIASRLSTARSLVRNAYDRGIVTWLV